MECTSRATSATTSREGEGDAHRGNSAFQPAHARGHARQPSRPSRPSRPSQPPPITHVPSAHLRHRRPPLSGAAPPTQATTDHLSADRPLVARPTTVIRRSPDHSCPPPTTYLPMDHQCSAKSRPYRSPPTTYVRDDHLLLPRPRHSRESGGRRPNTRSVEDLVVGERFRGRPRASIPGLPPPAPTTCATTDHLSVLRPPLFGQVTSIPFSTDHLCAGRPFVARPTTAFARIWRSKEQHAVGQRFGGR